jgi:hypothetical protein
MIGNERPSTRAQFIEFLKRFRVDLEEHAEAWENPTLGRFLGAMQAWISDTKQLPADVTWGAFAAMLQAARIYE